MLHVCSRTQVQTISAKCFHLGPADGRERQKCQIKDFLQKVVVMFLNQLKISDLITRKHVSNNVLTKWYSSQSKAAISSFSQIRGEKEARGNSSMESNTSKDLCFHHVPLEFLDSTYKAPCQFHNGGQHTCAPVINHQGKLFYVEYLTSRLGRKQQKQP